MNTVAEFGLGSGVLFNSNSCQSVNENRNYSFAIFDVYSKPTILHMLVSTFRQYVVIPNNHQH